MSPQLCPLCGRPMPEGSYNAHHLIPTTHGGRITIDLHIVCHDKIHHTFSEHELSGYYHTIDRLLSHPEIVKFVQWVRKQRPDFYDKHKDTRERNKKRKR